MKWNLVAKAGGKSAQDNRHEMTGIIKRARPIPRAGFTLLEIMIVVSLIALLAVIAIPALARARSRSAQNLCISNLRSIDDAKCQWALENRKGIGVKPRDEDLFGPALYLRTKPECPAGGQYEVGKVKEPPSCNVAGHELTEEDSTKGTGGSGHGH